MSSEYVEPAFPASSEMLGHNAGMTLRDYFAAKAMQATITNPDGAQALASMDAEEGARLLAQVSYRMADAMLAERSK